MFYEEQVINGILNYRSSPASEWAPFTAEQLTSKLMEARRPVEIKPVPIPYVTPSVFPVYPSPTVPAYPQPWWQITCGPNSAGAQS